MNRMTMLLRNFWLVSVLLASLLSGCAVNQPSSPPLTRQQVFPGIYGEKPVTVLVLPAINHSTAADAGILYSASIAQPLTEHGYYVLPVPVTNTMLHQAGISDGAQLLQVPPQRFADMFGADAALYVTIESWDTNYYVVGGNVTVGLTFRLVSTHTAKTLWAYHRQITVDTTGRNNNSSGNPLADLIGGMIATAITTAQQDYFPIAQQVNYQSIAVLPYGKLHPQYNLDASQAANAGDNQKLAEPQQQSSN